MKSVGRGAIAGSYTNPTTPVKAPFAIVVDVTEMPDAVVVVVAHATCVLRLAVSVPIQVDGGSRVELAR